MTSQMGKAANAALRKGDHKNGKTAKQRAHLALVAAMSARAQQDDRLVAEDPELDTPAPEPVEDPNQLEVEPELEAEVLDSDEGTEVAEPEVGGGGEDATPDAAMVEAARGEMVEEEEPGGHGGPEEDVEAPGHEVDPNAPNGPVDEVDPEAVEADPEAEEEAEGGREEEVVEESDEGPPEVGGGGGEGGEVGVEEGTGEEVSEEEAGEGGEVEEGGREDGEAPPVEAVEEGAGREEEAVEEAGEAGGGAVVVPPMDTAPLVHEAQNEHEQLNDPALVSPMEGVEPEAVQQCADIRSEQASARLNEFLDHGQGVLDECDAEAEKIEPALLAAAEAAKASLDAAMRQALGQVNGAVQAGLAAAESKALAAQEAAKARHTQAVDKIKATSEASRQAITAELATREGSLDEMKTSFQAQMDTTFSSAADRMRAVGTRLGEQAVAKGNERASGYAAQALPSTSALGRFFNGKDYEKNKRKARVDAAKQVGQKYRDEFVKKANEAADGCGNGKSQVVEGALTHIETYRTKLQDRKTTAFDQITKEECTAIEGADKVLADQNTNIEQARCGTVSALEGVKTSQAGQIRQTARTLKKSIDDSATGAIEALKGSVEGAKIEIQKIMDEATEGLDGVEAPPDLAELDTALDNGTVQLDTALETMKASLAEGMNAAKLQIEKLGTDGVAQLGQIGGQGASQAHKIKADYEETLKGFQQSSDQALGQVETGYEQTSNTTVQGCTGDFGTLVGELQADLTKAEGNVATKLGELETNLDADLQKSMGKLDGDISSEASKAADKVQPAWKGFLKILISIIVAVIVAVAIGALIASGVGIGLLLLGGALIGAAGAVVTKLAHNALDGKPLSEGLVQAAITGAISGMLAAVGGKFIAGPLASRAGTWVTGQLANTAISAGTQTLINTATQLGVKVVVRSGIAVVAQGINSTWTQLVNTGTFSFGKMLGDMGNKAKVAGPAHIIKVLITGS